MSEQIEVRVTGRQFRHDGEEYHTGDTLEVPERAIEGWEARLERVNDEGEDADTDEDGGGEEEGEGGEGGEGEEPEPHPRDLTVSELEDRIEGVDDPDLLRDIRAAEEDADDRSGATDAIDDRLNDLDEEE